MVGQDTFGVANRRKYDINGNGGVDTYWGSAHQPTVTRGSAGRYNFYDGDGDGDGNARLAGYDYRTCN